MIVVEEHWPMGIRLSRDRFSAEVTHLSEINRVPWLIEKLGYNNIEIRYDNPKNKLFGVIISKLSGHTVAQFYKKDYAFGG